MRPRFRRTQNGIWHFLADCQVIERLHYHLEIRWNVFWNWRWSVIERNDIPGHSRRRVDGVSKSKWPRVAVSQAFEAVYIMVAEHSANAAMSIRREWIER